MIDWSIIGFMLTATIGAVLCVGIVFGSLCGITTLADRYQRWKYDREEAQAADARKARIAAQDKIMPRYAVDFSDVTED